MPNNDNPGLARRDSLAAVISTNHTPGSVYIPAVSCINSALKSAGVGLSQQAFDSISNNVKQVANGTRTEAAASLHESVMFTRDTVNALRAGHFGEASVTVAGVLMNGVGSAMYFANYDRERMSPQQRAMYDAMSPM